MKMSMKPLQSSSVASRCLCGLCGKRPDVVAAAHDAGVQITARCCGKSETRVVSKDELLFTQRFFAQVGDGDESGFTDSDDE
jgi:hypothetical protein